MNMQPLIELIVDDNIVLRPYSPADIDAIFNLIDRNRKHLSQYGDDTSYKYPTRESVAESIENSLNPNKLRLGIWVRGTTYVGAINLAPFSPRKAELGGYLGEEFQGNGYVTRSVERVVSHAMGKGGFDLGVLAKVHMDNAASRSVLKRCGFRNLGKRDNASHFWYGIGKLVC